MRRDADRYRTRSIRQTTDHNTLGAVIQFDAREIGRSRNADPGIRGRDPAFGRQRIACRSSGRWLGAYDMHDLAGARLPASALFDRQIIDQWPVSGSLPGDS